MNQSDSIAELAGALATAASTLTAVQHDRRSNGPAKNRYATLDAILETVRPQLQAVGVSIQQGVGGTGGEVSVTTQLTHTSGQWMRSTVSVPVEEQRGCSRVQALGIHVTYLRRYSLLAILGLSTTEDDRSAPHMPDDTDGVMPGPLAEKYSGHKVLDKPVPAPEPKRWTDAARKAFCAAIGDLKDQKGEPAGITYDEVAAMCERMAKPRPSVMTSAQRDGVLSYLRADVSRVAP